MDMTRVLTEATNINLAEIETTKAEIARQKLRRADIVDCCEELQRLLLGDVDIALAELEARLVRIDGYIPPAEIVSATATLKFETPKRKAAE